MASDPESMGPLETDMRGILDAPGCIVDWKDAVALDRRPWHGGPVAVCQEVNLVVANIGGAAHPLVVKGVQEAYLETVEGHKEQVANEIDFYKERVTLRQCRSLGIVPLLFSRVQDGVISQYYEYAGPTLHQLFVGDTSGLDPELSKYSEPEVMWEALGLARRLPMAVPIFWKLLRRLEWLHKKGIVHRDLKPSNLCLDANQDLRLIDCGTLFCRRKLRAPRRGKRVGGHAELRGSPIMCCTWAYLAPEGWVALDDQEHTAEWPELWEPLPRPAGDYLADPCIDMWAAGVTLYEVLTGVPPFGVLPHYDASERQCHAWLGSEVQRVVPRIHPDWPAPIAEVLRGMLEKHPDERWSAARCVQHLRAGGFAPGGEGWEAAAAEAARMAAADAEAADAAAADVDAEAEAVGGEQAALPQSGRSSPRSEQSEAMMVVQVDDEDDAPVWAVLEAPDDEAALKAKRAALAKRERELEERAAAATAREAALLEREQAIAAEGARLRAARAGLNRGNAELTGLAALLGGKLSAASSTLNAQAEALHEAQAAINRNSELEARREALLHLRAQLASKAQALEEARAACRRLLSSDAPQPDISSGGDAQPPAPSNTRRKGRGATFKKHAKAFTKALLSTNEGWACDDNAPRHGVPKTACRRPVSPAPRDSAVGCLPPLLQLLCGAGRGKKGARRSNASGSSIASHASRLSSNSSPTEGLSDVSHGGCAVVVLAVEATASTDAASFEKISEKRPKEGTSGKTPLAEKLRCLFVRRPRCAHPSP